MSTVKCCKGYVTILDMEYASLIDGLFYIAILVISVVAHEVSHGFMAERLGDPTARLAGRLTVNPVRHIDPFGSIIIPLLLILSKSPFLIGWAKPVPYNPNNLKDPRRGGIMIALAGPLTNVVIALLFGLLIRFGDVFGLPGAVLSISTLIVFLNLMLAIFNLIPVPPLDGSKVLFAFLPPQFDTIHLMLERYWFLTLPLLIFIIWQFLLPIVFWFFRLITGLAF